jgi:hypothetical protein
MTGYESKRAMAQAKVEGPIHVVCQCDKCKAQPAQETVAWHSIETMYPQGEMLDIRMGDGSILCNLLPQMDGDLWWESSGIGEKFIDPKYADVTHWRIHSDTTSQQRPWVDLTDEQIADYLGDEYHTMTESDLRFFRLGEASAKEKA